MENRNTLPRLKRILAEEDFSTLELVYDPEDPDDYPAVICPISKLFYFGLALGQVDMTVEHNTRVDIRDKKSVEISFFDLTTEEDQEF